MTAVGAVDRRHLDWLLVDFVRGTPGVTHALVVHTLARSSAA